MTTLDTPTLDALRERRQAGERLPDLAAEVGLSWQKLHVLIFNTASAAQTGPSNTAPAGDSPPPLPLPLQLVKRYAPQTLDAILGQRLVVSCLRRFVQLPYSAAFLFEGGTGVGKTSTALALAAELGCDVAAGDLGGLQVVASGEQTADAVREAMSFLHFVPMKGSGWKVLVVNEADRMSTAAETIWLDALERLPGRSLVVFTTNHAAKLSDRFRDRCVVFHFAGEAKTLHGDASRLLARVWRDCTGTGIPAAKVRRLLREAERDGTLSFRRVLQQAEVELMAPKEA